MLVLVLAPVLGGCGAIFNRAETTVVESVYVSPSSSSVGRVPFGFFLRNSGSKLAPYHQYRTTLQRAEITTHLGEVDGHPFDVILGEPRLAHGDLGHVGPARPGKLVEGWS